MRQVAREHVAHDLHVFVAVGAKAGAGRDAIFIDDAQVAKAHVGRVVVAREREAVKALEPAMVGPAAILRFANAQHVGAPCVNFGVGFNYGLAAAPKRKLETVMPPITLSSW